MALFSKLKTMKSTTAAFLFGIWLTTAIMTITFRAIRVFHRGRIKEFVLAIDVYKSDILFLLSGLLLGLAALYLLRNRKRLTAFFLGFAVFTGLIITGMEAIAFRFFGVTGSNIDFKLMSYTLENFDETRDILKSEIPTWLTILLIILIVLYILLPLGIHLIWKNLFKSETVNRTAVFPIIMGASGFLALFFAFFPPFKEPSLAFAKNATLHIVSTGIEAASSGERKVVSTSNFDVSEIKINGTSKTNVVFIILESTRASATSVYDSEFDTTPFLKELAGQSVVADRAYSIVPHTSKALTASLCGIPPNLKMRISEATKGGLPGNCLAKLLRGAGYRTSFFQAATQRFEGRPTLIKNMGYKDFFPSEKFSKEGFEKANYFGREDDIMLKPSLKWLQKNKSKGPVFMTYLTLTPHHNYEAPKRYGFRQYTEEKEFNRYLNTVHYVDQFTKNVLQIFKDEGIYDDTLFVIYGDHGEGFGEHGRRQHDNVIWEEGTKIPLMFYKKGTFIDGKKIKNITSQLDIVPTVLSILGFETQDGNFAGENILPDPDNRTLFSYCWYDQRCIAIREGNKKYIHHFGEQVDEFYNLDLDPDEKNNIIGSMENSRSWIDKGLDWKDGVTSVYNAHYQDRIKNFVSKTKPKFENDVDFRFEKYVKLIGYDLSPKGPYSPGTSVKVTSHWQVLKQVPKKYRLFLHGYPDGGKRDNFDHTPVGGFYPVDEWQAGDFVSDEHRIRISKRTKSKYHLSFGLYRAKPKRRMTVNDDSTEAKIDLPIKASVEKNLPKIPKIKNPKLLEFKSPIFPKLPNGTK